LEINDKSRIIRLYPTNPRQQKLFEKIKYHDLIYLSTIKEDIKDKGRLIYDDDTL